MGWIERVQNKPRAEKIKIIWICVIIAAVILIVLWVVTWGYRKRVPKDTTFFQTFSKSIQDVKKNFKLPPKQ